MSVPITLADGLLLIKVVEASPNGIIIGNSKGNMGTLDAVYSSYTTYTVGDFLAFITTAEPIEISYIGLTYYVVKATDILYKENVAP